MGLMLNNGDPENFALLIQVVRLYNLKAGSAPMARQVASLRVGTRLVVNSRRGACQPGAVGMQSATEPARSPLPTEPTSRLARFPLSPGTLPTRPISHPARSLARYFQLRPAMDPNPGRADGPGRAPAESQFTVAGSYLARATSAPCACG